MSYHRDKDVERARELLRTFMSVSDMSRRKMRRILVSQGNGTDVSRLLSGILEPRLRHILEFCRILGLHHGEFFAIAYPRPAEPTAFLVKVRGLLISRTSAPAIQDEKGPKPNA